MEVFFLHPIPFRIQTDFQHSHTILSENTGNLQMTCICTCHSKCSNSQRYDKIHVACSHMAIVCVADGWGADRIQGLLLLLLLYLIPCPVDLHINFLHGSTSVTFFLADNFWLRKITTAPHFVARVNIVCPVDRYPKLRICISELILDRY